MRRWATLLLAALALTVLPAAPAAAHTVGGVGATNFRTTLSALTPAVAGVELTVVENGSQLQLTNATTQDVVVSGYGGEPYARVGPGGVYVNDNSPATYVNADRFSRTQVPAGVDPKAEPRWRRVGAEPVWRWHDHRVHWMLQSLPPAVVADPTTEHRVSAWTVELTYGEQRLVATGTLDWIPGPSPWPWVVFGLVVAGLVAAAGLLRAPHRWLGLAAFLLVAIDLGHGLGAMIATVGTVPEHLGALLGSDALLVWPFALFAAWLLGRGHTRAVWLAAVAGAVLAIAVAVEDAPVLWRSSAPTALPIALDRAGVAAILGLGVGLVAAVPVLLRRHPPAPRPWVAPPAPGATPARVEQPGGAGLGEGGDRVEDPPGREDAPARVGRRQVAGFLAVGAVGALAGTTGGMLASDRRARPAEPAAVPLTDVGARAIAYHGVNQPGIVLPHRPQAHAWVAGWDLMSSADRAALRGLLRRWTVASAALMAGRPLGQAGDPAVAALGATADQLTAGLGPAALTVTVGFGPSLFDRLALPRPDALAPLPAFAGDRLDPARGDGDLGVVIAGDDPVIVAHAARVLTRLATDVARPRWVMSGFNGARGAAPETATPRNLMGQVDGTNNPRPTDPTFTGIVFADEPAWLRGGSYLVVRRIRMLLDDWDRLALGDQERVIGRRKDSGAPLSGGDEHTPANYGVRAGGDFAIPVDAHMRLAAPAFNEGAAMLRRGFSYVDGNESGLLFLAWQADPRRGFVPVQRRLSETDALRRFIRHESSALFAMPGGVGEGSYLGQGLIES